MAKKSRQKGMRKAYLKRFSAGYISTGQGPDQVWPMGAKKGGTFIRFPASLKSRNVAARSIGIEPLPETQFHGKRGLTMARAKGDNPVPLAVIIEKRWQGTFKQGVSRFNCQVMLETESSKILLYFAEDLHIFVEILKLKRCVRRSVQYRGRQRALDRWRSNRVTWIEAVPLREIMEDPTPSYSQS